MEVSSSLFYIHGILCASHPVEVLLTCVTGAVCLLTLNVYDATHPEGTVKERVSLPSELHVGTTSYFLALLCIYLQCRKLFQLGSKHLSGIVAVFTVFSCLVYSSTVANLFGRDFVVVREAVPFFFLLSDFTTVCALSRASLQSASHEEAVHKIAEGMASLGPAVTLNTVVGTLVISIGRLTGVDGLRTISDFACLGFITHYLMFMTFYPALLSLFLELCDKGGSPPRWHMDLTDSPPSAEPHASNPVVQHVKLVMSAGLMFVHLRSWRKETSEDQVSDWTRILAGNAEQVVALVLAVIFASRYLLSERDDVHTNEEPSTGKKPDRKASCELRTCKSESDLRAVCSKRRKRTRSEYYPDPSTPERSEDENDMKGENNPVGDGPNFRSRAHGIRSLEDCKLLLKEPDGVFCLSDEEVCLLVDTKNIPMHQLEKTLRDPQRAVDIRRSLVSKKLAHSSALSDLPYECYDYSSVMGSCCENVIGYMPLPVGVAGPLLLDGRVFYVPMATTEGCLVASTNRGCRALSVSGGVRSSVFGDSMTRGPVIRFPSAVQASDAKAWLEEEDNFCKVKTVFNSTSRFAKLKSVQCAIAGRLLFVRFVASSGDAMGMNMLSKGTEKSLHYMQEIFPTLEIISLSGNYCTDKKAAAINWIQGRGKSVVCEAIVPGHVVNKVLKTSVSALTELNVSKNLVGSAVAGAMGGFNAHAANIVTALFIATGQDPAQNVSSSNCITLLEACGPTKDDLYISCTMPSLEVGTVGGGTVLAPQAACLKMLGVQGPSPNEAGQHASQLARIVCGTVLAAELSLLSALAAGHLVQSHLKHNRSTVNLFTEDPTKNCAVL